MKKIVAAVAVTFGVMSLPSFATQLTGVPVQPGNQGCELLSEAVTVNLSSNVFGAYSCNTTNNTIRVATCHKGGSRKSGTVACAIVNQTTNAAGDTVNEYNGSNCTDANAATERVDIGSLGKGFSASTAGGSVATVSLGAVCESAAPVDALLQ